MRIYTKTGLIIALAACFSQHLSAQNSTNLPTSMYGVGELSANDGGRLAGMGSVGIGINRLGFQNTLNPAGITRVDSLCFTFEVGAAMKYAQYSYLSDQSSSFTANPNRFSLGFRAMKRWYVLIGAAPYSSVGYVIRTAEPMEGLPDQYIYSYFRGEGGLYQAYLTNAWQVTHRLSVGLKVGMILGNTTQSETQEEAVVQYESKKKAFYTSIGMHYRFPTLYNRTWEVGILFSPSLPMHHDNTLTYDNSSTSEDLEKPWHTAAEYLPMHLGFGMSMSTGRWMIAADYNYINWSRSKSNYQSADYENQHKLNAGTLYALNPRLPRPIELMAGIGYGNSYISMKNKKMNYLELNAGASFPIRFSYLSISMAWRKQMNRSIQVMQDSSFSLNLNLTFGEKLSRFRIK